MLDQRRRLEPDVEQRRDDLADPAVPVVRAVLRELDIGLGSSTDSASYTSACTNSTSAPASGASRRAWAIASGE
ncbi:MAG TPA: hypothetical protein VG410_05005 [Solirubrobacteraceae bacterium]|nr:hypothetical protein [Solirubrobacteraceae bacterium]